MAYPRVNGTRASRTAAQSGFTLVEILIALLVLSIGLLGLAGLQTAGLRANHSANLRTQATLLAYDMTDRMRANREGYEDGDYDDPTAQQHSDCGTVSGCTPAQMAAQDRYEWDERVAEALPQGEGVVCLDNSPDDGDSLASDGCSGSGNTYAVKVWWVDEFDANGDPVMRRFATGFQP